jgi:hypothetical protein
VIYDDTLGTKQEAVTSVDGEAVKADAGKPDISLIPHAVLCEVARGFMDGERKYGRHNFRQGMAYSRYISAAYRHLGEFNNGMDVADDSGVHHLAHAICCCVMLYINQQEGAGTDDRHKPTVTDEHDSFKSGLEYSKELGITGR